METTFDPTTELDLEGEGLQPWTGEWEITNATIDSNDNGQRWVVEMQPADGEEVEGLIGNTARDSGYLTHVDREDLVKIGKGNLKRLGQAVLGTAQFSLTDLIGERVIARVTEDSSGFARIGRYRKAD